MKPQWGKLQKFFQISCVYYLFSQRFLYLITVKLLKVGNNLLQEMNPQCDCIFSKNTCFQQIFMGAEKESKRKCWWLKNMENTMLVVFKYLSLSRCVLLFFLLVFSLFRGLSFISSVRYFFVEAYPFKNICQMEIFLTVYLPSLCFKIIIYINHLFMFIV